MTLASFLEFFVMIGEFVFGKAGKRHRSFSRAFDSCRRRVRAVPQTGEILEESFGSRALVLPSFVLCVGWVSRVLAQLHGHVRTMYSCDE